MIANKMIVIEKQREDLYSLVLQAAQIFVISIPIRNIAIPKLLCGSFCELCQRSSCQDAIMCAVG